MSCDVFTGKDRACLPTKTLRQSLSELERLHFATCTSPPDRPATSGPKCETMSRAVSTMETHGALAKQGNQPKDICRFDLVDATTVMKRDKCKHPYKRCTFYMRQVVDFMQICTCARMNACIRFLQAASQHVPSFFESTCKKNTWPAYLKSSFSTSRNHFEWFQRFDRWWVLERSIHHIHAAAAAF